MSDRPLGPRLLAEFVGTAFLLAGVVGSGIMAEELTDDVGLQLFQNAFATAGVLLAIIWAFGPASGAHFNPAVTLADRLAGGLTTRDSAAYMGVQIAGGILGVVVANLMFDLPAIEWATKARTGSHQWLAELVATFGLVVVIHGVVRSGKSILAAPVVAGYIGGAYYFTSSTSFANPAVTVARTMSDTFAGIDPAHAAPFIVAQAVGAVLAVVVMRVVYPSDASSASSGATASVPSSPNGTGRADSTAPVAKTP